MPIIGRRDAFFHPAAVRRRAMADNDMTNILAFAGSARKASFNKRLIKIAAAGATDAGANVTLIDLADFQMPLFDQDLEAAQGMPAAAGEFKTLLSEHDGFLIASPEYNSTLSPLLKNAVDWASRSQAEGETPLTAYAGKFAGIMAASPGAVGGLRGLVSLRMLLGNLGVTVLPEQVTVPHASKAFAEDGSLIDPKKQQAAANIGGRLARLIDRLKDA